MSDVFHADPAFEAEQQRGSPFQAHMTLMKVSRDGGGSRGKDGKKKGSNKVSRGGGGSRVHVARTARRKGQRKFERSHVTYGPSTRTECGAGKL